MVNSLKYSQRFFESYLKLISSHLIFIENIYFMVRELRNRMSHASFRFHCRLRILLKIREYNQIKDLKYIKFHFE